MTDWWAELYDDTVAELLLVRRDPAETAATVRFLLDRLGLAAGRTAFDQCCGIGLLAVPLAATGVRVIGVDQSRAYVERARAAAVGLPCEFVAADAFRFTPPSPCDAGFNWGTGFGNAPDDGRNREMLRRAFDALKPGGRFALDYQNVPRVIRTFQKCLSHRLETPAGEVLVLRECELDLPAGAMRQRWTFAMPDGTRQERHSHVRLYLPHEVAGQLAAVGFTGVEFFGDTAGQPLDADSPRCILVARRPE
jgi:SAM-dependent methyltransferase